MHGPIHVAGTLVDVVHGGKAANRAHYRRQAGVPCLVRCLGLAASLALDASLASAGTVSLPLLSCALPPGLNSPRGNPPPETGAPQLKYYDRESPAASSSTAQCTEEQGDRAGSQVRSIPTHICAPFLRTQVALLHLVTAFAGGAKLTCSVSSPHSYGARGSTVFGGRAPSRPTLHFDASSLQQSCCLSCLAQNEAFRRHCKGCVRQEEALQGLCKAGGGIARAV